MGCLFCLLVVDTVHLVFDIVGYYCILKLGLILGVALSHFMF